MRRFRLSLPQKFLIGPESTCVTFLQKNIIIGSPNGFRVLNPGGKTIQGRDRSAATYDWRVKMS